MEFSLHKMPQPYRADPYTGKESLKSKTSLEEFKVQGFYLILSIFTVQRLCVKSGHRGREKPHQTHPGTRGETTISAGLFLSMQNHAP